MGLRLHSLLLLASAARTLLALPHPRPSATEAAADSGREGWIALGRADASRLVQVRAITTYYTSCLSQSDDIAESLQSLAMIR